MFYRELGNTGVKVSAIGFGGIVVMRETQETAGRAVAFAIDNGVNYFDVAPGYDDAEERLGPALRGYRDKVFLACKTHERSAEGARKHLERSLKRLETDHFDLYQLHGLDDPEEFVRATSPGGALEVLKEAKERGLTRFVGITTHRTESAIRAIESGEFDTVLFPINFVCWHKSNLGPEVLKAAGERGVGRIAMKVMALRPWPEGAERSWKKAWYQPIDDPGLAGLAVRFTLSKDVNVLVPPGHFELFQIALKAAEDFRPIEADEQERLRRLAATLEPIFPSKL